MSLEMGRNHYVNFNIPQTELLAGTPIEVISPVDGFIKSMHTIVQTDIGTGGAVTAAVGTTPVDGLSVTVADAATKGTVNSDTPTKPHASRKVSAGDRIQIVPAAAFATAGALAGHITINTGQ